MEYNKLPIQPIAGTKNKVFIQLAPKKEQRTKSGLYIANDPKLGDKQTEGYVVGISAQDENGIKPTVKVGDFVYFSDYAGKEFPFEGVTYLVMKEHELHARLIQKDKK